MSGELISGAVGGLVGAGTAMIGLTKLLIRAALGDLRKGLNDEFLPRRESELLQESTDRRLENLEALRGR